MVAANHITKVKRSSSEPLRDQILHRCRMLLMCGHVLPGEKLPLRPLAHEFNTSLMPVRDALNRLVADGALELSSSRVIRVPPMTEDRLVELHEIRRALEGLAAEFAAPNLGKPAVSRLQELKSEMQAALDEGDFESYVQSHYSFHFTIYAAANRPTLLDMIDMLWLQVGPWFRQGIERGVQFDANPNAGHEAIIAALIAKDTAAARQAVEMDVFAGVGVIRE